MPVLYIAANRALMTVERKEDDSLQCRPSVGGLATALRQKNNNQDLKVRYLGWPGLTVGEHEKTIVDQSFLDNDMFAVYLSDEEKKSYYDGCNKILWPLLHEWPKTAGGGISAIEFDDAFWPSYEAINQRFADTITAKIDKEKGNDAPLVWVHDYHLMLSPEKIKEKCPKAKIGFFLHIPFPPYETFKKYPQADMMLKSIIRGLSACDHISFQTATYRDNFIDCVRQYYGKQHVTSRDGYNQDYLVAGQRIIKVNVTPIGIDYDRYATDYSQLENLTRYYKDSAAPVDVSVKKQEINQTRGYKSTHGHTKTLCSIGRLDNSKGFLEQLRAFKRYLAKHPEQATALKLRLVVVPSRTTVKAYQELKTAIDNLVKEINEQYTDSHGAQPIDYQYRSFDLPQVTEFYRDADVMLVTPKRDGMNLVCMEWVAARQRAHGGVLVLGQGAGAADLLCDAGHCAVAVNPGDDDSMDQAFEQALGMSLEEQQSRLAEMKTRVEQNNVFEWRKNNVDVLTARRHFLPETPTPGSVQNSPKKMDAPVRRRSSSTPTAKCKLFDNTTKAAVRSFFSEEAENVVGNELTHTCSDAGQKNALSPDERRETKLKS